MELENQGLQAQLADAATQLHNASSAHEEAAAQAARLQGSLEEAQKSGASVSAELSACTSKVRSKVVLQKAARTSRISTHRNASC